MSIKLLCIPGAKSNFMKIAPLVRDVEQDPLFSYKQARGVLTRARLQRGVKDSDGVKYRSELGG